MKILITGATSGIGQQVAMDYASAGHQVIACGRNQDKLDAMAKLNNMQTLAFDVSDPQACAQQLKPLQGLDVVILSAGVCEYVDDAKHFESALVERVFQANFFGMLYCAEALLPQLEAGAKLVFIDSMSRLLPFTRAEAYGASKAATFYFAKSLAVDLADQGIQVVTVSPGFVKTPMTDANDFKMPMRIGVEAASQALRQQLDAGKSTIYFPRRFGWMLRFMNKLPTALQLKIVSRMKDSQ